MFIKTDEEKKHQQMCKTFNEQVDHEINNMHIHTCT